VHGWAQQWGLSAADESLSNDQKKAKLEQQLKEVNEDIESEIKSKKGLGTAFRVTASPPPLIVYLFIKFIVCGATDKLVKFYAADPVAQKKAVQVLSSVLCAAMHTRATAHAHAPPHTHAHGDRHIYSILNACNRKRRTRRRRSTSSRRRRRRS
jgi:hypothetical protein